MGEHIEVERDTREREQIFARLRNRGDFIPGLREKEPLPDGVRDEA